MTTDLVERLRAVDISWSETGELFAEAADEIERLREALTSIGNGHEDRETSRGEPDTCVHGRSIAMQNCVSCTRNFASAALKARASQEQSL